MPCLKKNESTDMQTKYARELFVKGKKNRKAIALSVGFSPAVANNVKAKVETREGFKNAMFKLAKNSNRMALAAIDEFQRRGLNNFSNKDLVGALNAIANAWAKFNKVDQPKKDTAPVNRLRTVVMQNVENQNFIGAPTKANRLFVKDEPKVRNRGYNEERIEDLDLGF